MSWRRFTDGLFRFLAVKGWKDGTCKIVLILAIIMLTQMAFTSAFLGNLPERTLYYALCALFVGGPWVALFFWISSYQVALQQKLSRLSRKDGLTGMNNRRTFFDLAQRSEIRAAGGVVLMIDADNFKSINDTHGHAAGDECLKAIAYRITRNLRDVDVRGRLGGEEFAVYLNCVNLAQAKAIAARLLTPIPYSLRDYDSTLTVTLSIGGVVATAEDHIDDLLSHADLALFQAKQSGKA
ncbi:diguanylate cyclase (GGDEF) domain-containing protein [Cognatiyoonia sediminum]|uniref:diguanylate cyclase n=1 Tax=Cognatiyoonia sediminum TaxID=1508389 RepID=A0A1M5PYV7_9RHOB|nr:GGDEF domain-containing protein [Cognatiyoonia sediminum]SHH06836.1 diguanylate cyclase (GGDEF) domain-containing protein [Cognatiyoonia sediminum]